MRKLVTAGIAACLVPTALWAEVVRFDIVERVPAFAGRSFGDVGSYERITARATIALDPADDRNAIITDLALAPRTAEGKVEATADVVILRPADPAYGNGTLLLDVPNRGRKLAPQLFDDSAQPGANQAQAADDAGIGFLHRNGYTMVWVGWQADIPSKPGQMALSAPIIKGVTGPAREEYVFDNTTNPARATLTWPAAEPANLAVTVRAAWADARQAPSGLTARLVDPTTVEIARPDGFDAGALYEITYTARDPMPLGMGYAAVRDVISFLRRDTSAANPLLNGLHPSVNRAIGFGVSQSGRFLRDFLYLGFNQDMQGRLVFDGLMPHVGGTRRMATNVRFGQPGRNPRHPQDPAWQADLFPFTYATLTDPISGRTDGLLRRCSLTATCPKVMQTDSEHEWWASHASLLVTDLEGNHLDLPDNVRAYMIAGTPHFAEANDTMHAGDGAAAEPDACGRADASLVDRPRQLDPRRRASAREPRADACAWHAGPSRRRGQNRHSGPALCGEIHAGGRLRPERAAAEKDRPVPGVRAEGRCRRDGDRRRAHDRARSAARDLHGVESACAGFWTDRALSLAGRRGALCADRSRAEGGQRSATIGRRTLCR